MTTRAIVLFHTVTSPDHLSQSIAGVPMLLRLLLCAQRAGIGEIVLLGAQRYASEVQQILSHDPRLLIRPLWLEDRPWSTLLQADPLLEKQWWDSDLWVLPAGGVIDVRLLRDAVQQAAGGGIAVIDPGPEALPRRDAAFCRVSGARLQSLLESAGETTLSASLAGLPRQRDLEVIGNHGLVCAPVVVETNRRAVERGLFRDFDGASDGWVDRYLNRRLSPWLSRWFLRRPLTPNHVTLIAMVIGLISALCFAHGSWLSGVIGALFLQWSAVIDCCDGEIARLKFLESTSGYYLDIACDNLVNIAVFVGIAWASYQELGQRYALLLGGLAAFGTVVSFIVVLATRHGRPRVATATLDRVVDAMTNRDFSLILVVCAVTATLHWFLWALAIGVNLFWPAVLSLTRRAQRTAHG
jgi:phosphatidylglycerophosphate synthase